MNLIKGDNVLLSGSALGIRGCTACVVNEVKQSTVEVVLPNGLIVTTAVGNVVKNTSFTSVKG